MNTQEKEIQRTIWREQERDEIENLKTRLAVKHGLARDAKFELAWNIAWDDVHSEGVKAVGFRFDLFAELLK